MGILEFLMGISVLCVIGSLVETYIERRWPEK